MTVLFYIELSYGTVWLYRDEGESIKVQYNNEKKTSRSEENGMVL